VRKPARQPCNLANVGPATLADLHQLGIRTVRQLARLDSLTA
jgi:predicted flap endonuclease-1-like 5' DNA nuclease